MKPQLVGRVAELWRYPVKSMQGEAVPEADLYWYGLDGDRRYAFLQGDNPSGFPWLTGRELPDLVRYRPAWVDPARPLDSPVRVQTPSGRALAVTDSALAAALSAAWGGREVKLIQLNRGATDTGAVSLIGRATLRRIEALAGRPVDRRRFRQNLIVEVAGATPFAEDSWLGRTLFIGPDPAAPAAVLAAIRPIERCQMVNIDPDTGVRSAEILRAVNRSRDNCAGIYLWPLQPGRLRVGDPIWLV